MRNNVVTTEPKCERNWTYPLITCSDPCLLIKAAFCFFLIEREIEDRLNWPRTNNSDLGGFFCLYCIMGRSRFQREKIKEKLGINGTCCTQSWILCCCFPCAVVQHYREVLLGEIKPEEHLEQQGYNYEEYE
ncbi:Oidioi.mRNA.OKI2018_I69.PAR.g9114.t1.cds [Oikopleura dioica]|uniref:Oidioi.mRNA.OKI2018_I69.PAR.g9114.t1.cds n=1 Tax=Oikopleura dioica TaxID=34765 RepID=A0ABN7RNG3_OIKDI|nr:Oidioi.mRNA.OKI2018_I69.PAR.g9114.t1.cds [Oikopleura dioica]